jgi:glycosyltransferase involved in cell wall biosynthesis
MVDVNPSFHFTIVIPTYQRKEVVLSSVRTLSLQERAQSFEVVVVDDGSTDGSAAALRELELGFEMTVIEQPNQGSAAARNRGAAVARGKLLLFLDDDMEAHPCLLKEHARSHLEGADVVFGHIPLHPDSPSSFLAASVGAWAEERLQSLIERDGRLELTDFLTGQMSLRRDAFMHLGGFDASFTRGGSFGGADFDFGRRLVNAGYKMTFNADAISWQRYMVSPRRYLRQWRDNGRARVMLARRYPDQATRLLSQRERASDRFVWRWFRWPLRQVVVALLTAAPETPRTIQWFQRVLDLEYFSGIRAGGGIPVPRPVRVLCYHSISDLNGAGALEPFGVSPRWFRLQLRLLVRYMHFIDGDEFRRFLEGGGVPRRAVLLTFDDCYQDLLDVALPRLREHRIPALAFAVTGLLGATNEWSGQHCRTLLDASGLRKLLENNVAIGSHTRSHRVLNGLGPAEISDEISGSIADLEALDLGRPSFLAYPYGQCDSATQRAASVAGLAGAFTTQPGIARVDSEPFAIPRIEIMRDDSGLRFILKVATGRRPRGRCGELVVSAARFCAGWASGRKQIRR